MFVNVIQLAIESSLAFLLNPFGLYASLFNSF